MKDSDNAQLVADILDAANAKLEPGAQRWTEDDVTVVVRWDNDGGTVGRFYDARLGGVTKAWESDEREALSAMLCRLCSNA